MPKEFQQLLGMTKIVLTPGSIRKDAQQCTFRQAFIFEINSKLAIPKHGEVFTLHETTCNNEIFDRNCALHDPNYVHVNGGQMAHSPHESSPLSILEDQRF